MDQPLQDQHSVVTPEIHLDSAGTGSMDLDRVTHVNVMDALPVGDVHWMRATFLQFWGVIFVACAGAWILFIGSWILIYFLRTQPTPPSLAGLTMEQAKDALSLHKQLSDQWRDSLTYIFDLLVTKTVMPVVVLLLGFLFGKAEASRSS